MAIRKRVGKKGASWQIDYLDPTGKRIRQSFKKKKDAEAELGKRVSLKAENRYLDVKKDYTTTLGELIEKYIENFRHQKAFCRTKRYHLEIIRQEFGEQTLLSNIRYVDLETYRNKFQSKLTKHGKIRTRATINREMQCLHSLLTKATEWEMVEVNPFTKGTSLTLKENNKRMRYLTEEEIERLLAECRHKKHLYRIVKTALNTGMRRAEILNLKWEHVRNGFIYLEAKMTKTGENREIPVNEDMAAIFKEIRKEQGFSSPYVFIYGGRMINSVDTAFNAAVKRARLRDFRFHDLPHTFASHLVMRGASLKEVQELLGHKNITMTMRYAHLAQEQKQKAVGLLNGLTASANVTNMSQIQNLSSKPLLSLAKN